jgi:hypothetical protein
MRLFILMFLGVITILSWTQPVLSQPSATEFVVFTVKGAADNHFDPTGWMGDYGDVDANFNTTENCHSEQGCLKFVYNAKKSQGQGWAGIYWQYPLNNWGTQKGRDLTGMKRLTFWARGEQGNEVISKFLVGGITGPNPDSDKVEVGPITLTKEWKSYTIDLNPEKLSNISGGFGWAIDSKDNPNGATFYIDGIKFSN